jgi:hypothetical protein
MWNLEYCGAVLSQIGHPCPPASLDFPQRAAEARARIEQADMDGPVGLGWNAAAQERPKEKI